LIKSVKIVSMITVAQAKHLLLPPTGRGMHPIRAMTGRSQPS
jgi:hypothetical protein